MAPHRGHGARGCCSKCLSCGGQRVGKVVSCYLWGAVRRGIFGGIRGRMHGRIGGTTVEVSSFPGIDPAKHLWIGYLCDVTLTLTLTLTLALTLT